MQKTKIIVMLTLFLFIMPYSVKAVTVDFSSSTADGYLSKSHAVYTTARTAFEADDISTSGYIKIGQTSGAEWTIYRGYFYFDTSDIPDDVRVQKAWLYFNVVDNPIQVSVLSDSTGSGYPSFPNLLKTDYDRAWYDTSVPGPGLSYTVGSTGWNNIILVSDSLAESTTISKTGTTRFALISGSDHQNNAYATGIMNVRSANDANPPYLKVQYNTPPSIPILEGKSQASIQNDYKLYMTSTDGDGESTNNKIKYKIDWGDGSVSWTPGTYTTSGNTVSTKHRYTKIGTYTMSVTAYDNSGEDNDHSGIASKTITVQEGSLPDEGEGIWATIASWFSWLFPEEDDGPNQQFKAVRATYSSDQNGERQLSIWWDVNKAALEQSNLIVHLLIETTTGTTSIGTFNVRDHTTRETAYDITNWEQKFPGYSTWSFVVHAKFLNPTEPADSPKDDNEASVRFILGFPIYADFFIALSIFIIFIIVVILLYRFRKQLFWGKYLKKPSKAEVDQLPEGYIKNLLEKRRKRQERIKKKQAEEKLKKGLETLKFLALYPKPKKVIVKEKYVPFYETVKKPVQRQKEKKTEPVKKKKQKKQRIPQLEKPSSYMRITTVDEMYTKPELVLPKDINKKIRHINSEIIKSGNEMNIKNKKEMQKKIKTDKKKLNALLKARALIYTRDRFRNIMHSDTPIFEKIKNIEDIPYTTDKSEIKKYWVIPELKKTIHKFKSGKISGPEAEKELIKEYNRIEKRAAEQIKTAGYKFKLVKRKGTKTKKNPKKKTWKTQPGEKYKEFWGKDRKDNFDRGRRLDEGDIEDIKRRLDGGEFVSEDELQDVVEWESRYLTPNKGDIGISSDKLEVKKRKKGYRRKKKTKKKTIRTKARKPKKKITKRKKKQQKINRKKTLKLKKKRRKKNGKNIYVKRSANKTRTNNRQRR